MALQHSSQPQTDGDYWCGYDDRQRGIKKVRENVAKMNLTCFQFRPKWEWDKERGALPSCSCISWSNPGT